MYVFKMSLKKLLAAITMEVTLLSWNQFRKHVVKVEVMEKGNTNQLRGRKNLENPSLGNTRNNKTNPMHIYAENMCVQINIVLLYQFYLIS